MPTIIRHYGRPMEAVVNGDTVERKDRIFLRSHGAWYETMPYDNHFIYETKNFGSSVMCTCGANAVVVNYDVYRALSSNKGAMLVCSYHMQTGKHSDGSS